MAYGLQSGGVRARRQADALRGGGGGGGASGVVPVSGYGSSVVIGSPSGPGGDALRNPASVTADTPIHPFQREAFDASKKYSSDLESGSNAEITRELQRARDEISVGMGREGEAAMSRGADPTFFRHRALSEGNRNIHALQGRLADVALGRRAEANRDLTGSAESAASGQRATHFGSLAARAAEQRNVVDQADVQSRLNEAPYNRLLAMSSTVNQNRGLLGPGQGTGVLGRRRGFANNFMLG